jgi:hypothetical protein
VALKRRWGCFHVVASFCYVGETLFQWETMPGPTPLHGTNPLGHEPAGLGTLPRPYVRRQRTPRPRSRATS